MFDFIFFTLYVCMYVVGCSDGLSAEERLQWTAREVHIAEQYTCRNSENLSEISKVNTVGLS